MPQTTPRLKLPYPTGTDRVSDYPTVARQAAEILDQLETTPWEPLPLSTGWSPIRNHTPEIRLLAGIVCIQGAVLRGEGGSLDNIATLPAKYRPFTSTQFIGASLAVRGASRAPSELYVDGATGTLKVHEYTSMDKSSGWALPLSCTFAPRK